MSHNHPYYFSQFLPLPKQPYASTSTATALSQHLSGATAAIGALQYHLSSIQALAEGAAAPAVATTATTTGDTAGVYTVPSTYYIFTGNPSDYPGYAVTATPQI